MPESIPYESPVQIAEGWLCLDYVNVIGWIIRHGEQGRPFCYVHLLAWARRCSAVSRSQAEVLNAAAKRHSEEADAVTQSASRLCAALDRMLGGEQLNAKNEAALNKMWTEIAPHARLVRRGERYVWGWAATKRLDRPLWLVVRSAVELLVSDDLQRVGRCANHDCGWLFFDASKNRSRRWCSMKTCGNAAKARRHYRKHKQSRTTS